MSGYGTLVNGGFSLFFTLWVHQSLLHGSASLSKGVSASPHLHSALHSTVVIWPIIIRFSHRQFYSGLYISGESRELGGGRGGLDCS